MQDKNVKPAWEQERKSWRFLRSKAYDLMNKLGDRAGFEGSSRGAFIGDQSDWSVHSINTDITSNTICGSFFWQRHLENKESHYEMPFLSVLCFSKAITITRFIHHKGCRNEVTCEIKLMRINRFLLYVMLFHF